MDTTWIVSANAGRARIIEDRGPAAPPQEIQDMINPAARIRTSDEYTDRLGPTSAGKSIHNTGGALPNKQYEPPQTPDEREVEVFAREVCDYLLREQRADRFQRLTLVAAPKFLGALRSHLDSHLAPLVDTEINTDYTHMPPQQLREQLAMLKEAGQ